MHIATVKQIASWQQRARGRVARVGHPLGMGSPEKLFLNFQAMVTWPSWPWPFQTRKFRRFDFSLCVVAERYILQQNYLKKWIGSTLLRTPWFNFQPPTPTLSATMLSVTDRQTDRQTVSCQEPIILRASYLHYFALLLFRLISKSMLQFSIRWRYYFVVCVCRKYRLTNVVVWCKDGKTNWSTAPPVTIAGHCSMPGNSLPHSLTTFTASRHIFSF